MTKPSDIRDSVKKQRAEAQAEKPAPVKKPFIPKPHLTHRPFVNSEIASLKASLGKEKPRG